MKRKVFLFGGSGGRMLEALLFMAFAGITPEETLDLVLCDPDGDGMHGAVQLRQELADYQRIWASRTYIGTENPAFQTEINLRTWCDPLPMNAKTLADWTQDEKQDALLCQAFFPADTASLDLRQGFHDHPELARVAFAAMLSECENDPDDAMRRTLDEIQSALNAGEEVRVVLAGSLCGGTGAAGIESVAALLQNRFGQNDNFRMGAVLMLPCADGESPARAQAALERISIENALQTVCLIGLPQSAQSSGGNDLPRLTDWLGAYCMDVLLHRPTWLTGTFTVQTADGAANWALFGKGDERYRMAFGGLLKGALLWQRKILPTLEKRLAKGNALKSGWIGWYPHYFRGAAEDIEDVRADAQAIDRLTQVALLYLAGIIRSLPLDLRYASVLEMAREQGREHYDMQIRRAGELAVLRYDAEQNGMQEDNDVHRENADTDPEAAAALERIARMAESIQNEDSVQKTFNRQMGGQAAMKMVLDALEKAENENDRLIRDYAEAIRRIAQAEAVVKPSERFRIDDAKTKLKRMERHKQMAAGMCEMLRHDAQEMRDGQLRFEKPTLISAAPENGLFLQEAMDRLLRGEKEGRKELAAWFPVLVQGGKTADLRRTMKQLGRGAKEKDAPAVQLLLVAMETAMQEENA